ncbi:hypothetical protein M9H77_10386 [Catharanthus roseus]|uniref:Uncharacterized protein n=1 Tax=Catharanthus roseus TaxID=4058 RepID=A0ACC0C3R3_CATRO|nr:hypothetical protein M9H77_10386 [Catharanthus roseus]
MEAPRAGMAFELSTSTDSTSPVTATEEGQKDHRRNMQGNTEANGENGFRRANVMKRIEILRRRRRSREVAKTGSSSRRWRSARIPIPPTPPARVRLLNLSTKIFYHLFQRLKEVNPSTLNFLFEKRLKYSDVKPEGRIVIPKAAAEKFMPPLEAREGLHMFMDDKTEVKVWRFRYRFWPNNASKVYVLENTGEFARARRLQIGDFLMIYKDNEAERFVVGVRRARGAEDDNRDIPTGGSSDTDITITSPELPAHYIQEVQSQMATGESSTASSATPSRSVPEVAVTSSSSYADGLQGFPMHLLNMNINGDLPDY